MPSGENPHEVHPEEETAKLQKPDEEGGNPARLMRTGVFTALAIGIHNFPEGLATFLTALKDPSLGVAIAIAVALHNIPEGISVSVPIYYASGSRKRAFIYSVLSGLAEPIGAVVAFLALIIFESPEAIVSPTIMGCILAGVSGIMVYISLDELIPASHAYGKGHDSIMGLIGGMLVMAVSLVMLR